MRVLITGGSGLLGKSLLETAPKSYTLALTRNKNNYFSQNNTIWYHLDIRNRADVFELFEIFRPNRVIHCASIGSVDFTENHYQAVRNVNVGGLSHVVDACNGYKCKLIYMSTNAVYGGNNPPYNEKSLLEPVNSYGIIKREAERLVRSKADKWVVIRPFMLYGWPYPGGRTNWAKSLIETLRAGNKQKLVDDIIWMPTYAPDCAEAIWQLSGGFFGDVFNVASPDRVTLYQFGLQVCDVFDLDKSLLEPIETDQMNWDLAKRPKDTTYDLVKLSQQGIMLSDVKTGLMKMKVAK